MDWFYWIIGGGPEILLSAIFFVVALPLAIIVAAVQKLRGK